MPSTLALARADPAAPERGQVRPAARQAARPADPGLPGLDPGPRAGCSTRWSSSAPATRTSRPRPSASAAPRPTWSHRNARSAHRRRRRAPTGSTPACCTTPSTSPRSPPAGEAPGRRPARGHLVAVRAGPPGRPDPGVPALRRRHAARPRAGRRRLARGARARGHRGARRRAAGRPALQHVRRVLAAAGRRSRRGWPPSGCCTRSTAGARSSATSTRPPRAGSSAPCSRTAAAPRTPAGLPTCSRDLGWKVEVGDRRRRKGTQLDVVVSRGLTSSRPASGRLPAPGAEARRCPGGSALNIRSEPRGSVPSLPPRKNDTTRHRRRGQLHPEHRTPAGRPRRARPAS